MMEALPPDKFIELFNTLNYTVLREEKYKPYNLNIVGYRNRFGRVNHFDDIIAVYYEKEGEWNHLSYQATTYPGTPNLVKPVNPIGTAILKPGQYLYKIGKHKGQYEALVQAKPVTVYRDRNRDIVYDYDREESGFFGINIHKASFGAKFVGADSAGCQVIKNNFEEFMFLIKKSAAFRENLFTYTLVEI